MKFRAALIALPFFLAACGNASSEVVEGAGETGAAKPAAAKTGAVKNEPIAETDMVIGAADAPVTLVEYASVTCPHCAAFSEQVMPAIKEKYIDTGKVKLVFREFPTPPANYALIGSVLARCAADKAGPEAYFLITDALFRGQRTWIKDNPKPELIKIVAQAGMDEAALDACLQRKELVDLINANAKGGMDRHDVQGTPSFILDGEKLSFRTKEEFEAKIAAAVEKAGG